MTPARAYTAKELDDLRLAVCAKIVWGRYTAPASGGFGSPYREEQLSQMVEERVRTHMIAGHTAGDLIASERQPTE